MAHARIVAGELSLVHWLGGQQIFCPPVQSVFLAHLLRFSEHNHTSRYVYFSCFRASGQFCKDMMDSYRVIVTQQMEDENYVRTYVEIETWLGKFNVAVTEINNLRHCLVTLIHSTKGLVHYTSSYICSGHD